MTYTTHSELETKLVAAEFVATLKGGEVVFLEGELGAGKTTFVQGAAEALGYEDPVRSPTFTLMNRYPVEDESIKEILHLDLYRIEDPSELKTLALEEELGKSEGVTFIEWPLEGVQADLGRMIKIEIAIDGDNRVIEIA
jgi:tRNA threonylcarbamoyladenosine biosynthesis protein TsaE